MARGACTSSLIRVLSRPWVLGAVGFGICIGGVDASGAICSVGHGPCIAKVFASVLAKIVAGWGTQLLHGILLIRGATDVNSLLIMNHEVAESFGG
jgi:hypothetical protein